MKFSYDIGYNPILAALAAVLVLTVVSCGLFGEVKLDI
jgi:hypothetical protein